jgi:L-fuculose-phosphate aldolase
MSGMLDQEFKRIGMRLHRDGLVNANFGNMSVRAGDGFYITRIGSYLDDPGSPVFVPLHGEVPPEASSEYRVHRQVYRRTRHNAIVHAHPAYAVGASLVYDEIIPRDSEGEMFCPMIPVVQGKPGSDEIARNVSEGLCLSQVVIVSGHGTFSGGKTLDEAYILTSLTEHSCRVLWLVGDMQAHQ